VARQTRAERRARRQQQAASAEPAIASAGAGAAKPSPAPSARPEEHRRRPGGGFWRFLTECVGELRKVEWPTQNHTIQATIVVLVACIVMGVFIWVADIVSKHIVQDLLLR